MQRAILFDPDAGAENLFQFLIAHTSRRSQAWPL